jgi:hypothetical protein
MNVDSVNILAKLRVCVAYLGEKEQSNWWPSSFLSTSGKAFLGPVFPKTSLLAQITGGSNSAKIVHDEFIGVGDVNHLFRLPENLESELMHLLSKKDSGIKIPGSIEEATQELRELAADNSIDGTGPLLIDAIAEKLVGEIAAAYISGFVNNQPVYPYFKGGS